MKKARKGMELFRIEVGHDALVKPGNIIGAIASEAGLDAENIGHIDIRKKFSLIELPQGMPKAVFNDLKNVWVCGQKLDISKVKISRYSPTSPQNMPSGSNRVAKKIDALGTGCKKAKKRKKKVSSVKVKKNKMKREGSLKN